MITMILLSAINEVMIKFYQKLGLITTFVKTEGMYTDQRLYSGYAQTIFVVYMIFAIIFMIIIPFKEEDKLRNEQKQKGA